MNYETSFQNVQKYKQEHLLKYYHELSSEQQEDLLKQIENIDWRLLDFLNNKDNAVKGKIEPLKVLELNEINENRTIFESIGLQAVRKGKVGAVLLAGGQGTRLGFDKPKGMLNVGVTKELYLFEMLIRNLMDVTDQAGAFVPLYIMTSDKNDTDTKNFFEEHNYFGYSKEHVSFFVQDMAPSVDYQGKILMESKDKLSLSPNGNGGWFSSMQKCGLLKEIHEKGIEWINVFSVDNVLQRIADPILIGATIHSDCVSGGKVVRKASPEERVGVLCLEDGKPSIIEYYEMNHEMLHAKDENGQLLYNFGVTLNYLFQVNKLEEIMDKNMPVHIVEKKIPHINENGQLIQPESNNGYKFETLVLDMIHLLDNCIPCEVERNKEFAPIKNSSGVDSLESARLLMQENGILL